MSTRVISGIHKPAQLTAVRWLLIGLQAGVAAVLAVVVTQVIILGQLPDLAAFKPLDSYARSALFTFVPAMVATGLFAWLVKSQPQPEKKFIWISVVVLLLSFIPDYFLPLPEQTLAGSTAAAFLHLVAGIVTVGVILAGYRRAIRSG